MVALRCARWTGVLFVLGVCGLSACGLIACSDDDPSGSAGTLPGRDGGGQGQGRGNGSGDGGPGTSTGNGICTSDGACEEKVTVGPPQHIEGDIDYADKPPAGGPHNPCWTSYGVHDSEARAENWVHNLEHGAVVYLYNCPDGCDADIDSLSSFVAERPLALLTAYPDMSHRFAVVSWGARLQTDELDLGAFAAFYSAHHDHGLESIGSGPPSGCL